VELYIFVQKFESFLKRYFNVGLYFNTERDIEFFISNFNPLSGVSISVLRWALTGSNELAEDTS